MASEPRTEAGDFPRWLNGRVTRFCGHGYHEDCKGTIRTIGIECACLCDCHIAARRETPDA